VFLAADNNVAGARIALGGVTDVPRRMSAAETSLAGAEPGDAAFAAAGAAARDAVTAARSDMHATADYRRRLAAVVVARALRAASARADGRTR